ncbi:MAG TPA: 2-oxoacid:ferredoxin oxidoreductase subunit gamma [Firmicutes bacterium]|nr:2-oxoacid:ferredoxin oxidoreductase subunit gamma [Bacillota bacterium]
MTKTIRIAGFGGQGVMLMGQLLAATASNENLNSIWVPSYGPETRGGTANCLVTISDQAIYSPVFAKADHCIVLNEPSYIKYGAMIKDGGLLLYNASLIKEVKTLNGVKAVGVNANEIAADLDEPKVMNMAILGAYLEATKLFSDASIMKTLAQFFGEKKEHLLAINEKALTLGHQNAK